MPVRLSASTSKACSLDREAFVLRHRVLQNSPIRVPARTPDSGQSGDVRHESELQIGEPFRRLTIEIVTASHRTWPIPMMSPTLADLMH